MTKFLMMTAAAVLSVATSPVMARDARPAAEPTSAVASGKTDRATNARPTRYCVEQLVTGSRIPVKTCATRAEWLERGFDPLAKD